MKNGWKLRAVFNEDSPDWYRTPTPMFVNTDGTSFELSFDTPGEGTIFDTREDALLCLANIRLGITPNTFNGQEWRKLDCKFEIIRI